VFTDVGEAVANGGCHVREDDLLAVFDEDSAQICAIGAAKDAHREFRAPGAHETGDADHFASADVDAGALDDHALGDRRMLDDPVLDLEEDFAELGSAIRIAAFERTTDHAADDAVLVDLT